MTVHYFPPGKGEIQLCDIREWSIYVIHLLRRKPKIGIMPTVLYNIGNTPLIQINKINKEDGIECDIRKLYYNVT